MGPVRRQTNTAAGAYWLKYVARKAQRLGKSAKWYGVRDGLILWAKRSNKLRTATVLDSPHRMRFMGLIAGVPGQIGFSPAFDAAGNRDGLVPNSDSVVPEVAASAREDAEFPSALSYFVGGQPPGGALFLSASYTAYPAASTPVTRHKVGHLVLDVDGANTYYPMSNNTGLWLQADHYGRSDQGVIYSLAESTVLAVSGGRFFPRGIEGYFAAPEFPITFPRFPTDMVGDQLVGCAVTTSQVAETERDYGIARLFVVRSTLSEEDGAGATQPYVLGFPLADQLTQGTWENNGTEYLPHFIEIGVVLAPDGDIVIHGKWLQQFFPGTDYSTSQLEQRETRFRVAVSAQGGQSWSILSCDTTGVDSDGLRVNSAIGQFRVMSRPSTFYGAGSDWAFYVTSELSNNQMVNTAGVGQRGPVDQAKIYIVRGTSVMAEGMPPGLTMLRGLPETITLVPLAYQAQRQQSLVCSHMASDVHFGVTFFAFDAVTEDLVLVKWDTENGFGTWNVDLTAINAERTDYLPAITCYSTIESPEGDVPAFVVSGSFDGTAKTFVVAGGVAKFVTVGAGLSAALLGNKIQTTALDSLYL